MCFALWSHVESSFVDTEWTPNPLCRGGALCSPDKVNILYCLQPFKEGNSNFFLNDFSNSNVLLSNAFFMPAAHTEVTEEAPA